MLRLGGEILKQRCVNHDPDREPTLDDPEQQRGAKREPGGRGTRCDGAKSGYQSSRITSVSQYPARF
jgi:hypothetical protein